MWLIREQSPPKDHILHLTYGECPTGFLQATEPAALKIGHFYRVTAFGVNELFRKSGTKQFEHFTWARYRKCLKEGFFRKRK